MSQKNENAQQLTARHILLFISACILMGIGFAFPTPVFSLFFAPIQANLGLTDAAPVMLYTTFVSVANILSALSSPMILRKGKHIVAAAAGVLMGVGYILLSLMPSLPMLYVAGFIGGFCSPIVSFIFVPIVISNWFHKNQGTFMGVAMAMTGLFGAVFSIVFTGIIAGMGWTSAVMLLGILCAAIIALLILLFVRITPQEMGLLPYGDALVSEEADEASGAVPELPGLTIAQGVKIPAFFLIAIAMFCIGALGASLQQFNFAALMAGFDEGAAAGVVAIAMIGVIFGNILAGVIKDKTSTTIAVTVNCVFGFAGFTLMLVALGSVSAPPLLAGGVLFGLCMSLGTVAPALICGDAFGPKSFDSFLGLSTAIVDTGTAVAAVVLAALFDTTGTYNTSFIVMMVAIVIIAVSVAIGIKVCAKNWTK